MSPIQAKILLDKYTPATTAFETLAQKALLKLVAHGIARVELRDGEILITKTEAGKRRHERNDA